MGTTPRYDLDTSDYGTVGWNNILKGSIEAIDDFLYTRRDVICGETLAARDVVFVDSDGKAWKAAPSAGNSPARAMMIEAGNADDSKRAQRMGEFYYVSWTWTVGAKLYLDAAGALTETKPAAFAQEFAQAISATTIFIDPKPVEKVHYGTADPPTPTGYENGIIYLKYVA